MVSTGTLIIFLIYKADLQCGYKHDIWKYRDVMMNFEVHDTIFLLNGGFIMSGGVVQEFGDIFHCFGGFFGLFGGDGAYGGKKCTVDDLGTIFLNNYALDTIDAIFFERD